MPQPLNPNFCCGCAFWNYQCVAPEDQPCANVTSDKDFLRTAHTRRDVKIAIRQTRKDIIKKKIHAMLSTKKKTLLLPLLLMVTAAGALQAQEKTDSKQVQVYFRTGQSTIDMQWMDNGTTLPDFVTFAKKATEDIMLQVDSIVVSAYTSPEGLRAGNDELTIKRADAIREFLTENIPSMPSIKTYYSGEDWTGFANYLSVHPELPRSERILNIIKETPSVGTRKISVMDQLTPAQWEELKITVFPELRRADIILYWTEKAIKKQVIPKESKAEETPEKKKDDSTVLPPPLPEQQNEPEEINIDDTVTPATVEGPKEYASTAVLGTNVLLDAITVPNISLEFPFGRHWSTGGAFLFPAWKDWTPWWDKAQQMYSIAQVLLANIHLSYYFIPWHEGGSRVLRGPYIRLFGYAGAYTFEHRTSKEEGILDQGNYYATGLSLGAAIPLGKWVRLDLSAGFGPSWTMNNHYLNYNIQGDPILVGKTTTMKWKAADAQVGVKYIFHRKVQKE